MKNKLICYKLHGLNFIKFIKTLNSKKIEIYNLKILSDNNFYLEIELKYKRLFLQVSELCNLKIIEVKPKSFVLKAKTFLLKKIGYVMCLVITLISIAISNLFVFQVEVYGNSNIQKQEILNVLAENNFCIGGLKSSYNLKNLEDLLKNKFDQISLVSCTILGNTLIVNLREDKYKTNEDNAAIVAPFNLVVKSVDLKSGTSIVNPGESIKKGETIIEPYVMYKDGLKLIVPTNADIYAYAEETITTIYQENHLEDFRSGKVQEVRGVKFFNRNINYNCYFEQYETERTETYLFNNFVIPIKKEEVVFYEIIKKQVYKPFNKDIEAKLIGENENLLYNIFSKCKSVENKTFYSTVQKVENNYLIITTISADIIF